MRPEADRDGGNSGVGVGVRPGVAALIGVFDRLARGRVVPYLALLVLTLLVYLPGVVRLPAVDRTEIVFADTTREMVARGAWMDPRYGDAVHQFRPIGTFWAQGIAAAVAGPERARDITVYRWPSLIAVTLAVLAVFWLAAPRVGRPAALMAAGLFAVAPLTVLVSQLAIADGLALLPATVAMLALMRLYVAAESSEPRLALLFWAAMGFGMLVNALHSPILVGVTVLALFAFDRDLAWLRRTWPLVGVPIALALAAPWLYVRVLQDGVPFSGMGWHEFLAALGGAQDMKLRAFPGTFLAAALIGFLPGVALLPAAMKGLWSARAQRLPRFLLAWTIGYIVYLELLSSKPGTYTVQVMYPAFALAVAMLVMRGDSAQHPSPLRGGVGGGGPDAADVHRGQADAAAVGGSTPPLTPPRQGEGNPSAASGTRPLGSAAPPTPPRGKEDLDGVSARASNASAIFPHPPRGEGSGVGRAADHLLPQWSLIPWPPVAAVFAVLLFGAVYGFVREWPSPLAAVLIAGVAALFAWSAQLGRDGDLRGWAFSGIAALALFAITLLGVVLPGVRGIWPSREIVTAVRSTCGPGRYGAILSFREPSAAFVLGQPVAPFSPETMPRGPGSLHVVESRWLARYRQAMTARGVAPVELGCFEVFNTMRGCPLTFTLLTVDTAQHGCAPQPNYACGLTKSQIRASSKGCD